MGNSELIENLRLKNEYLRSELFEKDKRINKLIIMNRNLQKQISYNKLKNDGYIRQLQMLVHQKEVGS